MTSTERPGPAPADAAEDQSLADAAEDQSLAADPAPIESVEHHEPADAAPPAVAVVVAHQPGPWFERCLASLSGQDYPNFSVLVIDAGSDDATATLGRVAAVLPGAYVRRVEGNPGFGPAANEVLGVVEGAAFFVFCHDDVALAPDAVRLLVEESYRSNAGIVGPKLVLWDQPERLLHVGLAADKGGVPVPLVERGELDQEQHDGVRDVFLVPSACMVVRADLFQALEGFDPAIDLLGEDVDLCWRAQVAGARVVVVPDARVEHRESLEDRLPGERPHRLAARHRLRTVLVSYGRFHALRVLPQVAVLTVIEAILALVTGHRGEAADLVGAWSWNAGRLREVRARRRHLRGLRRFPDSEVRRLQVRGSARFRAVVRGEQGTGDRVRATVADLGRTLGDTLGSRAGRISGLAWVVVTLVLLVGSRQLLTGDLPWVSGLARFDEGPLELLRRWGSGWRATGLGAEASAPTAFGALGMVGALLGGAMGVLRRILVLGCLPVGVVGAWRLGRHAGSRLGPVACLVVYASVPLPYDAIARGDWSGLLLYAASPWLVGRLLLAAGDGVGDSPRRDRQWRPVLGLAVLVAGVAMFVPFVVPLTVGLAAVLWLGGCLTGAWRTGRVVPAAIAAALGALVLLLPWSLELVVPGATWASWGGVGPLVTRSVPVGQLLRFDTGTISLPALSWAVPVAAVLPLLIGTGPRFRGAVRLWCVALACWAVTWASGFGHLDVAMPSPATLLAPGAAALALSVALGAAAFERDLRGFRFGWRQVASIAAAAAAAVAVVPVVVTAANGRWKLPTADLDDSLSFTRMAAVRDEGAFRVLWLGNALDLPVAGFPLEGELTYALTEDGPGTMADRWAASPYEPTPLVADTLRVASVGGTDRLGRLLAAFGIRYVVVVRAPAPDRTGRSGAGLPAGVAATAGRQLDLRRIDVDPALAVFENAAWFPARASVDGDLLAGADSMRDAVGIDLTGSEAALGTRRGPAGYAGKAVSGTTYAALPADTGWSMKVDGRRAEAGEAFGWAQTWMVPSGRQVTLRHGGSPVRWLFLVAQVAAWVTAAAVLVRWRRRRQPIVAAEPGPSS